MKMMIFDVNSFNLLCVDFNIDFFKDCLSLVNPIVIDYLYVLSSIIATSIIGLIVLESSKAGKIIKQAGQVGTAVLAGVGAVDSTLNLYDRYKESKGSHSEGSSNNSDNVEGDGDNNNKSEGDSGGNTNSDSTTNSDSK